LGKFRIFDIHAHGLRPYYQPVNSLHDKP
jgi:hypothetical protein